MVMPDGMVVEQTVHLKAVIDHPRITVGDFSYYHNFAVLPDYAAYMAPYLFPLSPEKLVIGKFCQFAHGVRFITSSANHDMSGFSTYPFATFMLTPDMSRDDILALFDIPGRKGDTVIGNDVWMGVDCLVMPGVTIGDGVICAARSVITRDVPPYTIVAGNPAEAVRRRFDEPTIAALQEIRWWDWPAEVIEANHRIISGGDIDALRRVAERVREG
ncbi:CatB-related O-acetyltransferase [Amorphus sp. 3PC139-8]|uniref:CatB-related O-acetyltransferase n=1 Tax=Amorphus sp. 3PC139-8 TaxID=2735676 RepID=UPI00345D0AB8